jgi:PAS domain S-box-containing protein
MFDSLSIKSKFLIAPLVGLLATLALYFISNQVIRSNTELFRQISNLNLTQIGEINEISILITTNNNNVVTLLIKSSDLGEERIYIEGKKRIDQLFRIQEKLDAIEKTEEGMHRANTRSASELLVGEIKISQQLQSLFSTYRNQITASIEMSSVDIDQASYELTLAHEALVPLNELFLKLSRDHIRELSHQATLIDTALNKNNYIHESVLLLFVLALWFAFYVAKDTSTKLDNVRIEQETIAVELRQLIDTANAPIFGVDAQGKINEWNQQAENITGFTKGEVMGQDLVASFIADDYKKSVGAVLDKALKGEETANFEFPLFTKAGAQIDLLLNSTTRRDAMAQVVGVIGVGQDITELNQVRSEQDIERKEATAQIIQASKLATLGEMSTSVAHELNQPLNVIRMAAGNGRRKMAKGTADLEYLNDKLVRIEEQTARAAAIIGHMRMFGRRAEEHPKLIDPRDAVTNALELIGEQLRLGGIEVVTELPEGCSSVLGHAIQIEQVILNLLTNARDAMAERNTEAKITVRVFEDDEGVHITSEDTGGGIPNDVLPRVFEPFYTTKEIGKGTGLGLSVSYGIIHEMNGTIVAENIDNGARFTMTFPSSN